MRNLELRIAVVAALKASAPLAALLAVDPVDGTPAVFDHVPQNALFPYEVVGEPNGVDHDTDDSLGWDAELVIHQFSRFRGFEEVERIQRENDDALNRTEPVLVDGRIVTLHRVSVDGVLDPDGLTRHGIHRFRAILEET
ncbi:MAG: DUF3168 domain-containing protein [Gammaproteobacteria bacterium]